MLGPIYSPRPSAEGLLDDDRTRHGVTVGGRQMAGGDGGVAVAVQLDPVMVIAAFVLAVAGAIAAGR